MPNSVDATETFRNATAPFLLSWQSVDLRAVLDLSEGQVLSLVACLSPEQPRPLEEIQPMVKDILFTRAALPISELHSLLQGWTNGIIEIGTRAFTTDPFSRREYTELAYPWDDVTSSWPDLAEYRLLLLQAVGPDIRELTKPRDVEAIGKAWGFRSFSEMTYHRVQLRVGEGRRTRMEIFAPILVKVEVIPEGTELEFRISIHNATQLTDMGISYRLQDERGNRIAGDRLSLSEFSPTSSGYFNILQFRRQVAQEVRSGEANLFHSRYHWGDEPIAAKHFVLPPVTGETNPRWDLIMSLVRNTRAFMGRRTDPEGVVKEDWLGLGLKRVGEPLFIRGMSCLLFAAGITKLSIGSEVEGVDEAILMTEPEQIAILLSYTTGPDIGGKARTLNLQVSQLQDKLQDYAVHGVIVAPLDERDILIGDIEDCKAQNINLVLRPDLEQMLQVVSGKDWLRAKETLIQILIRQGFSLI